MSQFLVAAGLAALLSIVLFALDILTGTAPWQAIGASTTHHFIGAAMFNPDHFDVFPTDDTAAEEYATLSNGVSILSDEDYDRFITEADLDSPWSMEDESDDYADWLEAVYSDPFEMDDRDPMEVDDVNDAVAVLRAEGLI